MTIVFDDREKCGWNLLLDSTFEFRKKRLKTGDYTILGLEKIVCIEKKSSFEELAGNISSAHGRIKLIKEFRRMQAFPVRIVVIEDSIPAMLSFESRYSKFVTPDHLMNWVLDMFLEYGIEVICTGKLKGNRIKILTKLFETIEQKAKEGRLYHGR
jgi:ERCC4-type nuclease